VAASAGTPAAELSVRELLALLDAELANLPPRYQSALLACYWQGQPQTAAARQLGITPAALKGLLERGRARLVNGLRRRGLTADVALRGLLVAPLALVALPGDLTARTAALPAGRVSPAVAKLLPATGWLRWGTGVAAALALGLGFVFAPSALPQGPAREAPA